jgi:Putative peptidoglycan binding domain/Trypsin
MCHTDKAAGRRLRRLYCGLAMLACLVLAPASALTWRMSPPPPAPPQVHPAAIFGADDRMPLPTKYRGLQEKMGLLFNPRSRMVCTAFCVAPDIVATAGHCLFRIAGERPPRIADFWFARNYDVVRDYARVAGHARGTTAQHVMSGAASLNMRPPIDATRDWAFVRLERKACSKGVLPVRPLPTEEIIAEAAAKHAFQVAYHRDFTPWKLAYASPCGISRTFEGADWKTIAQDFADADALLLHTCDTGGASSGSPILLDTPRGPEVIGINVGTYVQSKVEMLDGQVTRRFKAETVANTGVSATAFAAKLEAFQHAVILEKPAQVRHLQEALRQLQLYAGPLDGAYGAMLRAAIEAYEKANGMTVTGLATEELLKRLGGEPAAKAKVRAKS